MRTGDEQRAHAMARTFPLWKLLDTFEISTRLDAKGTPIDTSPETAKWAISIKFRLMMDERDDKIHRLTEGV